MKAISFVVLLMSAVAAQAQNCPPVDLEAQKAKEQECRATNGVWQRFGIHDHLCNIYSCAARTADGGKPCRMRAECEHQCITKSQARIGTEIVGECAPVRTWFGCFTYVDGGRIVGRICAD
jgi:hypothetical protein